MSDHAQGLLEEELTLLQRPEDIQLTTYGEANTMEGQPIQGSAPSTLSSVWRDGFDAAKFSVSRSWNSLSKTAKNVILATTGLSALALAFHYGPGVPRDTKVVVTEPEGYRLTDVNASWQNDWPTQEVSQPGENQRVELHMPPGSEIMMTATNPDGKSVDVSLRPGSSLVEADSSTLGQFGVRIDDGKWTIGSWIYNPEFKILPGTERVEITIHSVLPWKYDFVSVLK